MSMLTFTNADDLVRIADMYSLDRVSEFYANKVARTTSRLNICSSTIKKLKFIVNVYCIDTQLLLVLSSNIV